MLVAVVVTICSTESDVLVEVDAIDTDSSEVVVDIGDDNGVVGAGGNVERDVTTGSVDVSIVLVLVVDDSIVLVLVVVVSPSGPRA